MRNPKFFICFRMFFNARFYYPSSPLLSRARPDLGTIRHPQRNMGNHDHSARGSLGVTRRHLGRKSFLFKRNLHGLEMLALLFAPMDGSTWSFPSLRSTA